MEPEPRELILEAFKEAHRDYTTKVAETREARAHRAKMLKALRGGNPPLYKIQDLADELGMTRDAVQNMIGGKD